MEEAESSDSEIVKSIRATKPKSNSSKRSIILDSDSEPEQKRHKLSRSHDDSLDEIREHARITSEHTSNGNFHEISKLNSSNLVDNLTQQLNNETTSSGQNIVTDINSSSSKGFTGQFDPDFSRNIDSLDILVEGSTLKLNKQRPKISDHKTNDRTVQKISLRKFRKKSYSKKITSEHTSNAQSYSKNDSTGDEDIIFIEEVKRNNNLIKNNRREDLERMFIFSAEAEFIGKSIAKSIKLENVPHADNENL